MASDASAALGAPQLAGAMVNPKGFARQAVARAAGGVVGAVAAEVLARPKSSELPPFGRVGYLAVTADEVALVKTKTGLIKMKVTEEVLARQPRAQVTAAVLEKGAIKSNLKIEFADGGAWEFDVPKTSQRGATEIVEVLGGTIA